MAWLSRRPGRLLEVEVYYDSRCNLCQGLRRRVEALDWLRLVSFRSIWDPLAPGQSGVPAQALVRRLHVRWPATGRTASGLAAVAAVAARLPAVALLSPFLWLLASTRRGQGLYDAVARRRHALGGGCRGGAVCSTRGVQGGGLAREGESYKSTLPQEGAPETGSSHRRAPGDAAG